MYYYISDIEDQKVYKVQARGAKEAVRKWFRHNPSAPKLSDEEIDDALESGNLNIEIFSDEAIKEIV